MKAVIFVLSAITLYSVGTHEFVGCEVKDIPLKEALELVRNDHLFDNKTYRVVTESCNEKGI